MGDLHFIPITEFFSTYGYRTTFFAVVLAGLLAGVFGSLLYLRRQSLMSDVMGHSAIFGVACAFIVAEAVLGISGRSIPVLILGAAVSAFLSVWITSWISDRTPISADAAMAVSLALFYGGGLCLLYIISHSRLRGRAGLSDYIFGNAATTRAADLHTIMWLSVVVLMVLVALWKEFKICIFDPVAARMYGLRPSIVNPILMTCVTLAIVAGIKSVGMILMIAFAILPAAICHQFASSMAHMALGSGIIGALAGGVGTYLSISAGNVPTGPIVVLLLFGVFVVAIFVSPRRRRATIPSAADRPSDEASQRVAIRSTGDPR